MEEHWLQVAKSLRCGSNTRVPCCARDNSMMVSHNLRGYSGYCFRCGSKVWEPHGVKSLDFIQQQKADLAWREQNGAAVSLPEDYILDVPVNEGMIWLLKAGISMAVARQYDIGWSDSLQRVVLPVYRKSAGQQPILEYVQCRSIDPRVKPKYLNKYGTGVSSVVAVSQNIREQTGTAGAGGSIVVVEDILSMIRVGKIHPAVSILGTTLTDGRIHRISELCSSVILWLDGDYAGRLGAKKAEQKLSLMGIPCSTLHTSKDPKFYSNREIREILGC